MKEASPETHHPWERAADAHIPEETISDFALWFLCVMADAAMADCCAQIGSVHRYLVKGGRSYSVCELQAGKQALCIRVYEPSEPGAKPNPRGDRDTVTLELGELADDGPLLTPGRARFHPHLTLGISLTEVHIRASLLSNEFLSPIPPDVVLDLLKTIEHSVLQHR